MSNYFVDFSAGVDGSGSFASPYNTIIGKSFTASDFIWCRRKTKSSTSQITLNSYGTFVGWPKVGDVYYATRPSEAQSAWDGDTDDYAILSNTYNGYNYLTSNGLYHRFNFTTTYSTILVSGNTSFYNCKFNTTTNTAAINFGTLNYTTKLYDCLIYNGTGPSLGLGYAGGAYDGFIAKLYRCTIYAGTSGQILAIGGGYSYLEDCVFDASANTPSSYVIQSASTNAMHVFNNCTFKDKVGTTLTWNFTGATNISFRNCAFQVMKLNLSGLKHDVHLKEFTQTQSTDYAIIVTEGTLAVIDNATFAAGNTGSAIRFNANRNICLIKNCQLNSNAACTWSTSGQHNSALYIQDNNNTVGNWYRYTQDSTLSLSPVYRTSGESYSIKLIAFDRNLVRYYGAYICEPGIETLFADLAEGENTITLYGCHNSTGVEAALHTDYLSSVLDATRTIIETETVSSDDSVWNGIASYTAFKIQLTITTAQACKAPIRLRFKGYTSGREIYIDPKVVVT